MVNIPPNTVNTNKPEREKAKKIKFPDVKIYLAYVFLAVLILFSLKMYLNSIKKGQNKFYSVNKPYAFVKKNNKYDFLKKIFPALPFQKNVSVKQEGPKKLKSQNLILNGILFSPEKKLALINNIIVKEGDTVGDVVVLLINADYVELGSSTLRFKLRPYKK